MVLLPQPPPSFDEGFLDLEEELMSSPKNAAAPCYLTGFPRGRAMSTPITHIAVENKRRESLRAFQALRNEVDHAAIHSESSVDVRSARVAQIVGAASNRQSHRRPRAQSSSAAILRPRSVFADLFVDLPPVEKQALAQFVDEEFVRAMTQPTGASPGAFIAAHFRAIFRTTTTTSSLTRPIKHSLGTVVLEFATVFHALYQQHMHCAVQDDIAPCAAADVIEFSDLLVQVIRFKYPFLSTAAMTPFIQQAVEDAMFVHLQPTLHGVFAAQCNSADAALASIMALLQRSPCVVESIGVPALYRLDAPSNETPPYAAAIAKMTELPQQRSPSAKIAVVSQVCHLIDVAIQSYYAVHPNPPPVEKLHIAADDLVPVLAYVVVMSNCPHVASHLSLMDAFLPDRISTGEEAYAVTVLHTAVAHVRASMKLNA